ncbi:flagellar protein export ATPase FliI [Hippea maritima]|uniref:ATPase, FliI/YscN family n=1 Tax=Hippea maritima (strain ATCC 700847 / DSM 10411 / MH2) TaxID=760142 RepID=F2LWX6_HIPMA|nr:flagellar protein export ATPase FliI [Hippea maritima]AEA34160.1 ATPase, FliI/YscN family [Hippea maritima DSM 10411]
MSDILKLKRVIDGSNLIVTYGRIKKVAGITIKSTGPKNVKIGDVCKIETDEGWIDSEVVGFDEDGVVLMPLGVLDGVKSLSLVKSEGRGLSVPVSERLLGRVVNALGRPIDGKGPIPVEEYYPVYPKPVPPLERQIIKEPLSLGVKAIDGLLTIGKGQRVGIFAGSGVGKSTLLGMIARNSSADVNVIALIGERGREVREFIERDLKEEGLKRSVVVVATSDEASLLRREGAFVATSIAEFFKDRGANVMLMMDSATRFAMAQREIGLAVGEPPTTKGYTPSVFTLLPRLMERAGNFNKGSITAIYTVLVDGDDLMEPIADASRSILDGHIVLSRKIAERGRYPAVDVLRSISRLMSSITTDEHKELALKIRKVLSVYADAEDLINIGAYVKGSNKDIDEAIKYIDKVEGFLAQKIEESFSFEDTLNLMRGIFS